MDAQLQLVFGQFTRWTCSGVLYFCGHFNIQTVQIVTVLALPTPTQHRVAIYQGDSVVLVNVAPRSGL